MTTNGAIVLGIMGKSRILNIQYYKPTALEDTFIKSNLFDKRVKIIFCALLAFILSTRSGDTAEISTTGKFEPRLRELDAAFAAKLTKFAIPGASFCIARNGQVLLSRGYGLADKATKQPVTPDSLFRIASLSKPITAIAILKLCQDKKISLDQKAFSVLSDIVPCDGSPLKDKRIKDISIGNLLQCSCGWSDQVSGDPIMAPLLQDAAFCSPTLRPTPRSIIGFELNRRLDFTPGTQYAYCNTGYVILGQIIESASHQPYESYVKENIFAPLGLKQIYAGHTTTTMPTEVHYYPHEGKAPAILPNQKGMVSTAYGSAFYLESILSSAGWVTSAPELVKLGTAFNGKAIHQNILNQDSMRTMLKPPTFITPAKDREFFAMGWEVMHDKQGNLVEFSRHGSLQGGMALIACRKDGIVWAALFNSRPLNYVESREEIKSTIKTFLDKYDAF